MSNLIPAPNYSYNSRKLYEGKPLKTLSGQLVGLNTKLDSINLSEYASKSAIYAFVVRLRNSAMTDTVSDFVDLINGKNKRFNDLFKKDVSKEYIELFKLYPYRELSHPQMYMTKAGMNIVYLVAEHVINHLDKKQEARVDNESLLEAQESHFWRKQAKLQAEGKAHVKREI